MPVVTTLHTILGKPTLEQRRVMTDLAHLESVVVMSEHGAGSCARSHGAGRQDDPSCTAFRARARGRASSTWAWTANRDLTRAVPGQGHRVRDRRAACGGRAPSRGHLPALGATHPHVKERHGKRIATVSRFARASSAWRRTSSSRRFVSLPELTEFLSVADIYITPYLNPEQITSGTWRGRRRKPWFHAVSVCQRALADGRGRCALARPGHSLNAERAAGDRTSSARSVTARAHGRGMVGLRSRGATSRAGGSASTLRRGAAAQAKTLQNVCSIRPSSTSVTCAR
jgi:hypothetical protein